MQLIDGGIHVLAIVIVSCCPSSKHLSILSKNIHLATIRKKSMSVDRSVEESATKSAWKGF